MALCSSLQSAAIDGSSLNTCLVSKQNNSNAERRSSANLFPSDVLTTIGLATVDTTFGTVDTETLFGFAFVVFVAATGFGFCDAEICGGAGESPEAVGAGGAETETALTASALALALAGGCGFVVDVDFAACTRGFLASGTEVTKDVAGVVSALSPFGG